VPARAVARRAEGRRLAAQAARFRARLEAAAGELAARFARGVPARVLVRERAAAVDAVLIEAWQQLGLAGREDCALIAVGGYGRGELHPYSDVDILVLLERRPDRATREAIEALVALAWDSGLELSHSVRTLTQCRRAAREDITVATNLMESRPLAGPSVLAARLRERTSPPAVWPVREFFAAKLAEQRERHHRLDDTAYRLEPNLKESPGGLRDIQMVGWVAKRQFGAVTLRELVAHGFLTADEHAALIEGQAFLWDLRWALHLLAGRREDRLLFDHQRAAAGMLGYRDDPGGLGVERLMKRYYRTVQELSCLNEMLLELFEEAILHLDHEAEVVAINRRFRAVNGFLETVSPEVFRRNRFALLELFLVLQQHPELAGVRASTIRQVRNHRHFITPAFRDDIRARGLFLEILRQPRGITHELRRMHRYGVLGAYLPVFEQVVGQMQYDLFHAYTVDEHTLFVVRNLRRFAVPEHRDELPLCSAIMERLPKPELLYIAGLFHDLAKGRGGDHSEIGAGLAREFCAQHGLGAYDTRLVEWLVRHHLLMSATAQRRDITDPEVVSEFAAQVGDQTHLDYLYLLTVADIRATNPSLWNDWRHTLLGDLYEATARVLRRGREHPLDRGQIIVETKREARELLARRGGDPARARRLWNRLGDDYFVRHTAEEIAWHSHAILAHEDPESLLVLVRAGRGGTEVFVYAPDQKYLFAATTSVLERLGLSILDARIITAENGMTLDSYVVMEIDGQGPCEARRGREIRQALLRKLRDAAAVERAVTRSAARRLRHFSTPTTIEFSADERNRRTLMEVVAADRPGLLARIGWTLADHHVRLQAAKIATYGERVVDVFFITDSHNRPLTREATEALAARLHAALDSDDQPPVTGGKKATSSPSASVRPPSQ